MEHKHPLPLAEHAVPAHSGTGDAAASRAGGQAVPARGDQEIDPAIRRTLEFCVANPDVAPASPVVRTTIDFLQLVQARGAAGEVLVADVSGRLGKNAPYFVLGTQPFSVTPWSNYCSSGLHDVVARPRGGCVRQIQTLANQETVSHVLVDLDTVKSRIKTDAAGAPVLVDGKAKQKRVPPTIEERIVAVRWILQHGFAAAITPNGFRVYLLPDRPLLIKQSERELEPFVQHVFRDFPWTAAGLKLDSCSWRRLNGERISPLLTWQPETIVPVPGDLPILLYDSRERRIGVSVGGEVVPWRTHRKTGNAASQASGSAKPPGRIAVVAASKLTSVTRAPLLGETCRHIPQTSAEKGEACSHALGMRARYLAWGVLQRGIHDCTDFVWQSGDAFVSSVSRAVGLPAEEVASIFSRYPPEEVEFRSENWGRLNVPCSRIYAGHRLAIRGPNGVKEQYAEFARSIYLFPNHKFSLAETMEISWKFVELMGTGIRPMQALRQALGWRYSKSSAVIIGMTRYSKGNSLESRAAAGDDYAKKCVSLLRFERGLAAGLADLFRDTARLLGGDDQLRTWLETDCPRLCRKFWEQPWKNSSEVCQRDLEAVLAAVQLVCASDPNRCFTTTEIAELAGINADPRSEAWLAAARQYQSREGKAPLRKLKSAEQRRREAAHHKTQVALSMLGCAVITEGIKNPKRPGSKAKRRAPAAILDASAVPSCLASSRRSPVLELEEHKDLRGRVSEEEGQWWPLALRVPDITGGLECVLPVVVPEDLRCQVWNMPQKTVLMRLSAGGKQWTNLVKRLEKSASSRFAETIPPALQTVRGCLEDGGHTYQPAQSLAQLLKVLAGSKAHVEQLQNELIASGMVVDVSKFVSDGARWLAWRRTFEGEAAFAMAVVRHAAVGGSAEVIYGDPGTGKSELMARQIAGLLKSGSKVIAGSAQNNSARSLKERILTKYRLAHQVGTVHKTYEIPVDAEAFQQGHWSQAAMFADEVGQVDSFTAGAMASRWSKANAVVLTVGPGQLLPVGPGSPGEDLIECLQRRPLPGWTLKPLTENHRIQDKQCRGIADFFLGVQAGQVPGPGPGLRLVAITSETPLEGVRLLATKLGLLERESTQDDAEPAATCFFPLDELGAVAGAADYRAALSRSAGFGPGERVTIRDLDEAAQFKQFSRGDTGEVLATLRDGRVRIQSLSRKSTSGSCHDAIFRPEQLRSAFCRTGHASQGFEVDRGVVVILPSRVTDRRWLFTAVSRCRERCVVVYRHVNGRNELADCIRKNPQRRTLFPRLYDLFAEKLLDRVDVSFAAPSRPASINH